MIKHIIINGLEVFIAIGDGSFYGQQVAPVEAEVEFLHDMKVPYRVRLPDGLTLRCAMPKSGPVMVELPADYDITDAVDMDRVVKIIAQDRLAKEMNEIDRDLANSSWEPNHG